MSASRTRRLWCAVGAWAALQMAAPLQASAASLLLFQDSFEVYGSDGGAPLVTPYSDWGSARLDYVAGPSQEYFNLSVNGAWVVRNIPLGAFIGGGATDSMMFNFGLGDLGGAPLTSATYGYSISTALADAPFEGSSAGVTERLVAGGNGLGDPGKPPKPIPPPPGPPLPAKDPVVDGGVIKNPPNVECGVNRCVPAAVSNSLTYLNNRHKMGVDPALISTDALAAALGTTAAGTPFDYEAKKRAYLKAKKIPVDVARENDVADVLKAVKRGKDIEINMGPRPGENLGHTAFVTGVWKLKSGKYIFAITHDTDQKNNDKGTVTEPVYYDPTTKTLSGTPWAQGRGIHSFVIESVARAVPEPGTWALMLLGFGMVGALLRRRRSTLRLAAL